MRYRPRTDREGVALALVAVMMLGLLAILSLAIDLGMAYTARAEAQRVADAAALAGASAYLDFLSPFGEAEDTARARATAYVAVNYVRNDLVDPASQAQIEILPAEQKVRVWVWKEGLGTWFARFIGRDEIRIGAVAAAQAVQAGSSQCVKPFAIPDRWEEYSGDDYDGDQRMDFDNDIPCSGAGCSGNEVWTFAEDGTDVYRPANQIGSLAPDPNPTSWTDADAGAQLLISPQYAMQTGTPGWYQYWKLPNSGSTCSTRGTNCLAESIRECISLGDLGIGEVIENDLDLSAESADVTPGNRGKPVYEAIRDLIDADPDIKWDDQNNVPYYEDAYDASGMPRSIWASPRVFTVLLVHPADIMSGASHQMRIADLATVFLEDPLDYRITGGESGPDHQLPITGRLFVYGGGDLGPSAGELQKVLRLVE